MMMTRFLALVILLAGSAGSLSAPSPAPATDRQPVLAAASSLLQKFWPSLEKDRADYGLTAADSLETLGLGTPAELRGVSDARLRDYRPGQAMVTLSEPTGQWYVPLIARGEMRALIEVQEQGQGLWQGSGIGWVPLAQKWQVITRRWPATGALGPVLMVFSSQPGYYVTVPSAQPTNLTPLSSLRLNSDGSLPADFKLQDAALTIQRFKALLTRP